MTNKDAAKELFNAGWDQKRIAEALHVTEKTISSWKKTGNWDMKRTQKALAKETSEERMWNLINYQLKAIEMKTEEYEKSGEFKLLDRGDIDALSKMYSAVRAKQHTWAQVVDLITEFVKYIEEKNLKLAKEVIPHSDDFLLSKKAQLLD